MTSIDQLFRQASIPDHVEPMDIAVSRGRILAIERRIVADAPVVDLQGRAVLPGFVETHIHLDKACLLGRCAHIHGGLDVAIRAVSQMKREFTVEDVYARGASVLEKAIQHGTTRMRTHVEVDPRAGLRSFEAVQALKRDYAWAIDLSICVFPQEGLTNDPGAEALLVEALEKGADALGGCPYTDSDPEAQMTRLFDLARRFDVDLDFHLDFDLDPSWMHLPAICRLTERQGWQGRVAVGHVTKLSMMPEAERQVMARRMAECGVALTVLPATDLYLASQKGSLAPPRGLAPAHALLDLGVVCSVATNNVLNPFTPFGDVSLLRMANLYANVAQVPPAQFGRCIDMVTSLPARLMNLADYGVEVGKPADLVVLDAPDLTTALAEIAPALMGFRQGRMTFERKRPQLHRPS
ncbi:MAG: amidohydrolase family protein [Beijerinckiaceae bacterium]|nr:amidohydrolase family protein [Beijerinckiaceae bacterium]MCZ8300303.1 amidohydrolase family protein [Beijerinckiaceae bacterium]